MLPYTITSILQGRGRKNRELWVVRGNDSSSPWAGAQYRRASDAWAFFQFLLGYPSRDAFMSQTMERKLVNLAVEKLQKTDELGDQPLTTEARQKVLDWYASLPEEAKTVQLSGNAIVYGKAA